VAEIATVGGGSAPTVTVTDALVAPPAPVHVSVNVLSWLSAPVLAVPAIAWLPDQAREAVQDVAVVLDHVSVELPCAGTAMGLAEIDTPGGWATAVLGSSACPSPPQPVAAMPRISTNARSPVILIQLHSVRLVLVFMASAPHPERPSSG
jgi:hypothetical protein